MAGDECIRLLDDDDSLKEPVFDYSSAFQFRDPSVNYKSIFTFNKTSENLFSSYASHEFKETFSSKVIVNIFLFFSYVLLICTAPLSIWFCIKIIPDHERLLTFRLGRVHTVKGPGYVITLPCIEKWEKINIGIRAFSIPPQQLITLDGAIIEVGADIQFRIVNILHSILYVKYPEKTCRILCQSLFINSLYKRNLMQIQQEKIFICEELMESCNSAALQWGIKVEKIDIPYVKVLKQCESNNVLKLLSNFTRTEPQQSSVPEMINQEISIPIDSAGENDKSPAYKMLTEFVDNVSNMAVFTSEDATFRLDVVSSELEIFLISFKNGAGTVSLTHPNVQADVYIRIAENDLQRIINHDLTPLQAYIGGYLQIDGNMQLLMKFEMAAQNLCRDFKKNSIFTV